ncbi:MAG: type II secretion system protein GspL [Betaproteobacteria bacterium]
MSTLIVYLAPDASPDSEYDYVLSHDGQTVAASGRAGAALLPAMASAEVVAVVAVPALSWQRVQLPKGSISARGAVPTPRLRAVLDGLLEERLLDEPQELHFALAPDARPDAPLWVAVCARAWLKAALQALENAGRAATRIVPEFAPQSAASEASLQVIGTEQHPLLVVSSAQGVTLSPLNAAAAALARTEAAPKLLAEPAVAAQAEHCFKRPVELQQSAQRWLLASQSAWDLAQFDLASSNRLRTLKKLTQHWQSLRHAPQWRAARWGAGAFVLTQLLGLNLWAWHEKSALQAQRAAVNAVLMQTFPNVRVVVDAPIQMEREVAALRQATGTASGGDMETMLSAVSMAIPTNRSLSTLEFSAGEARMKGLQLSPTEVATLTNRLTSQGYAVRSEGEVLVLQTQGRP